MSRRTYIRRRLSVRACWHRLRSWLADRRAHYVDDRSRGFWLAREWARGDVRP